MFCQKRLLNFLSNAFCRQSGRQQSTFLDSGFGTRFDAETQLRRKADRAQHSQSVFPKSQFSRANCAYGTGFQISKRSEPEIQFYPFILKLNRLYATGEMVGAHDEETRLKGALMNSIMPAGIQRSLMQLIDKARIYSSLPADKSEVLAVRNLPPQGVTAPAPAAAPSTGIPDLPELF